ncbi:MAG: hypothetical protein VYA96_01860 [Verrucomicrobiota bacterium]|nr:hypothetical protein [Verrucomicrobiota bacterium]
MGICSVVSIGVLIFYAKRHRNPRLRPRAGEVLLVGIILFMGSGFFSHFTAELLTTDFDEERLKNNMKASQLRGLSNPTGSGVRSETLDKLREGSNNADVNGSTSSPEDFIESIEN